jgi:preprotein translocase subunit SecG
MLPITIFINILLVIHVLVSLLIILIVLMQRPKNEGLGAAFGGGMTENLFGAQTTNVLQTITRWLGGIFFVLTLALSILYVRQSGSRSAVQEKLSSAPVPAAATPVLATPAPSTTTPAPTEGTPPSLEEEVKLELPVAKPDEVATKPVQTPPLTAPELGKEQLPPVPGTNEKPPVPPPAGPTPDGKNPDAANAAPPSTAQPSESKKGGSAAPKPGPAEKKDATAQDNKPGAAPKPNTPEPPR